MKKKIFWALGIVTVMALSLAGYFTLTPPETLHIPNGMCVACGMG